MVVNSTEVFIIFSTIEFEITEEVRKIKRKFNKKKSVSKKDLHFGEKIFILVMLLIISLTVLEINKSESYYKYERIEYVSSGALLYANLYYPSKSLAFQDKSPLIIYCHGVGGHRDLDLRVPIEFTKRGFFVVALDYQGHGESGGDMLNFDTETNIPALAKDVSKLLDRLMTLPFYSNINPSQIGLIGHSLGGFVALINQALDPRFNVTVAWAPLIDPNSVGLNLDPRFESYYPVNLLNETNTENLLIIMHENDEALDFEKHALKAQELTDCTVIPITEPLISGGHLLVTDEVLIESIKWFESKFFNSEKINGPIQITFYLNYILIIVNLILLFMIMLSLISFSLRHFTGNNNLNLNLISSFIKSPKSKKIKQFLKIGFYMTMIMLNWAIWNGILGLLGVILGSVCFITIYITVKLINYFRNTKRNKFQLNLKERIRFQINLKNLIYSIIIAIYVIVIYVMFTFFYPFGFMWPSNILYFVSASVIFPIFLAIEILLRKIIYPQLKFIKSERNKTLVIVTIAIFIHIDLIFLTWTWSFLPSVLFTYFILMLVTIQNTLIYEKTRCFSSVIISSFIIVVIFFAAVISNAVGVSSLLHLLVQL